MNKIIKSILSFGLLFTMVGCIDLSIPNNSSSSNSYNSLSSSLVNSSSSSTSYNSSSSSLVNSSSSFNSCNSSSSSSVDTTIDDEYQEVSFDEFYEKTKNLPASPYKSVVFETTSRTLVDDEEVFNEEKITSYYLWEDGKYYSLETGESLELINFGIKYITDNLYDMILDSSENKEYMEKYYKFYISKEGFKIYDLEVDVNSEILFVFDKYGNLINGNAVQFRRNSRVEETLELKWSLYNLDNIPENGPSKKINIKVWVEPENVEFYTKVLEKYKIEDNLNINFIVQGVNIGLSAQDLLNDLENGADILKVSISSLAKLTDDESYIMPLTEQSLIDQVKADNTEEFVNVITKTMTTSAGEKDYIFAAPCQVSTNFLYYNKTYVSEEQAQTWEGLAEAASKVSPNTKACTLVGEDGYNFSWSILARQLNEDGTSSSTLKLYEDKKAENCSFTGDDMVAVTKWTQDYFKNPNGMFISPNDYEDDLKNNEALSVITGFWGYEKVKRALGSKLGVAMLPTFTINEDYGTIKAGTKFQSGSFYDGDAFVMKKFSPHAQYLQDIVRYLTSKEVQEAAFEECNILPSYKHAQQEFEALKQDTIEAKMANIQYEMEQYGITLPFGTDDNFNTYYYSSGSSKLYRTLIEDKEGLLLTYDQIKSELANIENIWKTGEQIR